MGGRLTFDAISAAWERADAVIAAVADDPVRPCAPDLTASAEPANPSTVDLRARNPRRGRQLMTEKQVRRTR
jgi:hypothetical protein